jgi:hypothetical protein
LLVRNGKRKTPIHLNLLHSRKPHVARIQEQQNDNHRTIRAEPRQIAPVISRPDKFGVHDNDIRRQPGCQRNSFLNVSRDTRQLTSQYRKVLPHLMNQIWIVSNQDHTWVDPLKSIRHHLGSLRQEEPEGQSEIQVAISNSYRSFDAAP